MAEVRKLTQADIDRILFQQSLGNRTPDQIIADNLAKGTGIQKLDPNFAQTAAAGARKVAQSVDQYGGVRNYLPFPIAGLLPPEVDAKVSDLMGITGTARFYDALGAGKAPNPLDVIDMAGVSATAAQGAKLGAKGVVAAGKAAAPVVGNMAEQYAVKTGLLNPMIAWHGSPYSFDKFDLAHVGKGEGAQAYGHGMYFAEAPQVADIYRKALTNKARPTELAVGVENAAWQTVRNAPDKSTKELIPFVKNAFPNVPDEQIASAVDKARGLLQEGSLYKVDIPDPAVETFLDWDKPLSQQPQSVVDALHRAGVVDFERNIAPKASGEIGELGWTKSAKSMLGEDLYRKLTEGSFTSEMFANGVPKGAAQAQVSQKLREAGIQGIRYLDGGSRGTGAGTSNFVVFDPSIVKILERNGQPAGLLEVPTK